MPIDRVRDRRLDGGRRVRKRRPFLGHGGRHERPWREEEIMDDNRFDGMARLLGAATARRGAVGLLAALGIGLTAGGAETVAATTSKRKRRKQRRRNRNRQRAAANCPDGQVRCGDFCYPECCPTDSRPCYSGPAATRNVGVCRDGSELCLWDGRWSGACVEEVTPGAETCNGRDDDCDGVVDGGSASFTCAPFQTCANGRCCSVAGAFCATTAPCCSGSCNGFVCSS
jgi:hypothetical protein